MRRYGGPLLVAGFALVGAGCQTTSVERGYATILAADRAVNNGAAESSGILTGAQSPTIHVVPTETQRAVGVAVEGLPHDLEVLDDFRDATGVDPAVVHWFHAFGTALDESALVAIDEVTARDRHVMITWEPWNAPLREIAEGDHDETIDGFAAQIEPWQERIQLRFGHEMNGNWYPWAQTSDPDRQGEYVAAYRYVVDRFRSRGVEVEWVWSPNVVADWAIPLPQVYPGDDYVDLVGIDGYNWGVRNGAGTWVDPASLFGPTVREVESLTDKPMLITETASAEAGGDKAAWIRDLAHFVHTEPRVEGVIWFDYQKERDWRVRSSDASARAFRDLADKLGG